MGCWIAGCDGRGCKEGVEGGVVVYGGDDGEEGCGCVGEGSGCGYGAGAVVITIPLVVGG